MKADTALIILQPLHLSSLLQLQLLACQPCHPPTGAGATATIICQLVQLELPLLHRVAAASVLARNAAGAGAVLHAQCQN